MSDLPPGFVLDQPQSGGASSLPAGFVLDGAPAKPKAEPSTWDKFTAGIGAIIEDPRRLGQVGPGRIVSAAADAARLPGDVATGRADPNSPEVQDRIIEGAMVLPLSTPAGVTTAGLAGIPRAIQEGWTGRQALLTERVFPRQQPASSAAVAPPPIPNPVLGAAERLGVDIPRGVASDSRTMQAVTQAARQMPFGGGRIEGAVDASLTGLRSAAERVAAEAADGAVPNAQGAGAGLREALEAGVTQRDALAARDARAVEGLAPGQGVPNAATLGRDIQGGLEQRIAANRAAQQEGYDELGRTILRDARVDVTQDLAPTLGRISRERYAAGTGGVPSDLTPAMELATRPEGASFAGLQRARSTLGERIDFEAGRGFSVGDQRAGYGAMTRAMEQAAEATGGAEGVAALRAADANFSRLATENQRLGELVGSGSEALVNRIIGYGSDLTKGNVQRLREIQGQITPEQRTQVSRLAYQRMGSDATGAFDVGRFAQAWEKMSPPGRQALFGDRVPRIQEAVRASQATTAASREANSDVLRLLGSSDENLAGRVIGMATSGASADQSLLARLATIAGPGGLKDISSVAIQQMGQGRIPGEFSPAYFAKNWAGMSEAGKSVLFADKGLRASLDDIATVSTRMAEVERKFMNKSGTGRAVALGMGLDRVFTQPLTVLASSIGGFALGHYLSQPAVASSAAKWSQAYERYAMRPTAATAAGLQSASRNLANTATTRTGLVLSAETLLQAVNDNSKSRSQYAGSSKN